jgi:hypothetical protein
MKTAPPLKKSSIKGATVPPLISSVENMAETRSPDSSWLAQLDDFAAEQSAHQSAEAIRSRRMQRAMEQDATTFVGVLVSLAEQRTRATVLLRSGWAYSGRITAVGSDALVMLGHDARRAVVRISAISSLTLDEQPSSATASSTGTGVTGDRLGATSLTFDATLRDLCAYEADITLITTTSPINEPVQWIGIDVARTGKPSQPGQYVRLESILAVMTP